MTKTRKSKLTKLSKAQEAAMAPHRDAWIKNGLRTGSYTAEERVKVRELICTTYQLIGRPEPLVLIARSPYEAQLMCGLLAMRANHVSNAVTTDVSDAAGDVDVAVGVLVGHQVRLAVDSAIHLQVDSAVGDQVQAQLANIVEDQSSELMGRALRSKVAKRVIGDVDAVGTTVAWTVDTTINRRYRHGPSQSGNGTDIYVEILTVGEHVDEAIRAQVSQAALTRAGVGHHHVIDMVDNRIGTEIETQLDTDTGRIHVNGQVHNDVERGLRDDTNVSLSMVSQKVSEQIDGTVTGPVSRAVDNTVGNEMITALNQATGTFTTLAPKFEDIQVSARTHREVNDLRSTVYSAVSKSIGNRVYDEVHEGVFSSGAVDSQVGVQVEGQVDVVVNHEMARDQQRVFWSYVKQSWTCRHMGNLWPWWASWMTFFSDHCRIDPFPEKREIYEALSKIGPRYLQPTFAVISDYPVHIDRDEEGRLHSATRAAIMYSDGFSVWRWHGTAVPQEWIMAPEKMSAAAVLQIANMEQRAAGLQIMGWARALEELNAVVIDSDQDPSIGDLLQCEGVTGTFLRVRCGTGRTMVLRTPPTMKTAMEAQLWVRPDAAAITAEMIRNMEART